MFCIANGVKHGKDGDTYKIMHNNQIYELPEVIYLFWEQFLDGEKYKVARKSFIKTGLPAELFDQTLEILVEDGLITIS